MADSAPWLDYKNQPSEKTSGPWEDYGDSKQEPSGPGFLERTGRNVVNSLPMLGGVVGGVLGTPADAVMGPMGNVVGAGIGGYAGTAAKNLINRYIDPSQAPQNMTQTLAQPVVGGMQQAAAQGVGEVAAPYIAKAVDAVASPVSDALKSFAAKKAVASTGATGVQASKFADNAGQELLDQGIVGFGNSQGQVASKASAALEDTEKAISGSLDSLDKQGATLDQADIISSLRKKAAELGEDPAQFGVSDQLHRMADRIQNLIESKGGDSLIPLSKAESTKRTFQANTNYNLSPAESTLSREAANVYRQAVEDAATKFKPETAAAFKAAKKTYGLLAPIEEAAAKRAATLNQSPMGGLLDTATTAAGAAMGGGPGAIIAPLARRAVAYRIAPTMAATANAAGNAAAAVPSLLNPMIPSVAQTIPNYSTIPGKNGQ